MLYIGLNRGGGGDGDDDDDDGDACLKAGFLNVHQVSEELQEDILSSHGGVESSLFFRVEVFMVAGYIDAQYVGGTCCRYVCVEA